VDEQRRIQTEANRASDESDLRLLHRIAHGDRDALRELYVAYYQPLLRFIQRITVERELAQEGVNDVMLIVWQKSESFLGRSKVSTWLMGIAYHRALRLLERSRRWSRRFKAADFDDQLERQDFDVDVRPIDQIEVRDLIDQALQRLSPAQRAVVELTYFGGYSYEEIAAITGAAANTVKTRMFYARVKLRGLLPALGKDEVCVPTSNCVRPHNGA
jgi:RNA polymerase sigma-70 factor (ECF subfamily)